ncbi:MAG: hypothetical protein ACREQI_15015 [Candidatus Binataceae bacterium]
MAGSQISPPDDGVAPSTRLIRADFIFHRSKENPGSDGIFSGILAQEGFRAGFDEVVARIDWKYAGNEEMTALGCNCGELDVPRISLET